MALVAADAATSNKKRRLSASKKDNMKIQLAAQEEDRLAKEKLADIVKALKSASYQTLLAVGAFLTEKGELAERVFPRCVKYYAGNTNRAVPMKVVIETLAACAGYDAGNLRAFMGELRPLFMLSLIHI